MINAICLFIGVFVVYICMGFILMFYREPVFKFFDRVAARIGIKP